MTSSVVASSDTASRKHLRGSLSLMWPLFQSLCFGQFVETLSCAVQGRLVMAETGMTLFEHSLAFAEAEAMVSNQLGWGPFGFPKGNAQAQTDAYGQALSVTAITRSAVLDRLNTPPEVLLIGLISTMSHLTSHLLAIFGLQGRFRLISTGFWGLCFMSVFLWSLITFTPGPSGDVDILRFPTVCIVGFIPHMLILLGILTCAGIYLLALLLTATAPPGPDQPRSFQERFVMAQQNLQANISLSNIRINMHEDFYTSLLKVGFAALTAASEAVFLNEGQPVHVRRWTWLEEERMREIEVSRGLRREAAFSVPHDRVPGDVTPVAEGVGLVEMEDESTEARVWTTGYGRERTTEKLAAGASSKTRVHGDGVGAAERSGRWVMAWDLFRGIFWLVTGALAMVCVKALESIGLHHGPRWLRKLARRDKMRSDRDVAMDATDAQALEFWLLTDDGVLRLPEDDQVDVEAEMRKRVQGNGLTAQADEEELDGNLYGWWKQGGWFGELDGSGTFAPTSQEMDDDLTSVISQSTATDDEAWESIGTEGPGRTTPTQRSPFRHVRSDTLTPSSRDYDTMIDTTQLAQLLDPRNAEDRHEAQLLSQHLRSTEVLTRSRYRQSIERQRARVLTSTRYRSSPGGHSNKPTAADEAEILEQLILSRREASSPSSPSSTSHASPHDGLASSPETAWATGASGLGSSGPQCVVCQSQPRTILVWPCRCLSLCEDCRVSLAMNNFGACVCCRRDVVGFSRIFVP